MLAYRVYSFALLSVIGVCLLRICTILLRPSDMIVLGHNVNSMQRTCICPRPMDISLHRTSDYSQ